MNSIISFFLWVLLGVLQGSLEWLPISSKTFLLIYSHQVLGIPSEISYDLSLFLQSSSVVALLIFFRRDLYQILISLRKRSDQNSPEYNMLYFIFLVTLVTGLIGLSLYFLVKPLLIDYYRQLMFLAGCFIFITGITRYYLRTSDRSITSLNVKDVLIIGFLQAFSVLPGVSRSGITIIGFILLGFNTQNSIYLSFLMGIPVLFGSLLLEYFISDLILSSLTFHLILSYTVSIIVSVIMIFVFMKYLSRLPPYFIALLFSTMPILTSLL
ncbi:hypothetical protein B6U74_04865 [Candidatus Bathyarchaeota archaeon ex4484_205]|nr:MAG: hypothetical protein B6U74_04865 [Candidatus Bathyarchaeota archaeon ex4484_205]RLG69455.1 MAG: hypothetical protein DRN93_00090 [archaeon]